LFLYLLRHGETAWNAEWRIQGVSNQPLNDIGKSQAKALIPPLMGRPITTIYTSQLRRARETAEILAEGLGGFSLHEDERLAELDQGELDGMVIAEIKEKYADFWKQWRAHPADAQTPGGECMNELQARAWEAVESIRDKHLGEMVVAVSHNLAITAILCRILGMDLNTMRCLRQHNAAINLIEYSHERGWGVVMMNVLTHLNGSLATDEKPYL
jgi:phosphoserine phosphatase